MVSALAGLVGFRAGLYGCFGRRADVLFELVDALAGASRPIRSVAELMFEPVSRRGWGSLYQALQHGQIDVAAARDLLACSVRLPVVGPLMFAVDTSKLPRPDTRVVPDVGMQYAAERDRAGGVPAVPGWAMQKVVQVAVTGGSPLGVKDSWVAPVDVRRVGTAQNANEIAAAQIIDLTERLAAQPATARVPVLFLLDVGYCPIYLTQHRPDAAQVLVRLRGDRVFFGRPGPRPAGKVGRPRKHGDRFALDEPATWGEPDAEQKITRPDGVTVWTRAWHHKHPEPRPRRKWEGTTVVEGTLIRREKTTPGGHRQVWWLWWAGPPDTFDLAVLADAYRHRFTCEHGFRFDKQDLFWTGHTPINPDQAERWSWIVAFAYTQLRLARPLAVDLRLPWEKPTDPGRLSPRRVQRVFRLVTADLPTPARPPKPSRPGPGRPKGSKNKHPRARQPVIRKGRPANTGHPKRPNPKAKPSQNP
ncbi:transposase [Micromonospora sp. CPCC 205371]|nr:transposase [Micromonospora sp. CPCC 205371]